MIVAGVGLGTAIGLILAALASNKTDLVFFAGLGVITFFIGIAFILNGVFLTVPRNKSAAAEPEAKDPAALLGGAFGRTNELNAPPAPSGFGSVTEGTTRHLDEELRRSSS